MMTTWCVAIMGNRLAWSVMGCDVGVLSVEGGEVEALGVGWDGLGEVVYDGVDVEGFVALEEVYGGVFFVAQVFLEFVVGHGRGGDRTKMVFLCLIWEVLWVVLCVVVNCCGDFVD